MKIVLLDRPVTYDGLQLATAFVDEHGGGEDDVGVLFEGEADVPVAHLVDLEDRDAGAFIYSPWMAHVILEHRGMDLRSGVFAQRLLMRLMSDWISRRAGVALDVRGDDLYLEERKLSVSVATASPRGVLVHAAVNVRADGAPVPALGLSDLRLNARDFLSAIGRCYADELESVAHAMAKVKGVS